MYDKWVGGEGSGAAEPAVQWSRGTHACVHFGTSLCFWYVAARFGVSLRVLVSLCFWYVQGTRGLLKALKRH